MNRTARPDLLIFILTVSSGIAAHGCAPAASGGTFMSSPDAAVGADDAADASSKADSLEDATMSASDVAIMDTAPKTDVETDTGDVKSLYAICAAPSGGTCPEGCEKIVGHPMRAAAPACAEAAELLFCVDYKFVTAIMKCRVRLSTGRIYLFPSWAPEDGDDADWRTCTKEEHDKSPATFCK